MKLRWLGSHLVLENASKMSMCEAKQTILSCHVDKVQKERRGGMEEVHAKEVHIMFLIIHNEM